MVKAAPIYSTFSRGEITPLIFGRVDTEQYFASLDKCRNTIIRPYGMAMRRSGTEFINETKDSTKKSRLIKFVFSNSDAYIIEVGVGYFRFYNNGGQVVKTLADTSAWGTSTAYVKGNYVKESNIIYYCLVAHTSGTFATDLSAGKWVEQSIYEVPNSYVEDQLQGIQFAQVNDILYMTSEKTSTSTDNKPKQLSRITTNGWTFVDIDFIGGPFLDANGTSTTITPSGTSGSITLTASSAIFQSGHVGSYWRIGGTVGTPAVQGYVKITAYTDTTHVTATVIATLSATTAAADWAEGAWSAVRGYPSCCTLHSSRLYLANSTQEPQKIWGSKPFSYNYFTPSPSNASDGAINIQLAAGDSNVIKWISSGATLAVGTFGGEFIISSSSDAGITPADAQATKRTSWGSERLQPERIGNFLYYIQRKARKLRELFYFNDNDTYKAVDMTLLSEHLTESGVIDTAYQQNPDSILWCVKNNGELVAFVREIDQQVQAWSLCNTDGLFESVETIPSYNNDYDEAWFIVNRTINGATKRYIERINNPITCECQDQCWYVDCGSNYDAFSTTIGNTLTLSGITSTVTVNASSATFSASMVGKRIKAIDENMKTLGMARIKSYVNPQEIVASVELDFSTTSYVGGDWGISVINISGLSNLEGKTLDILADGAVQTPKTVASGAVILELDAFYINIGLNYVSYIKTLPIEAGSANGTAVGKKKRIYQIALRVFKTLGIEIGKDLDSLAPIQFRKPSTLMGTAEELYTGVHNNVKYNQQWQWDSNITVSQDKPLPMNILAIAPQVQEVDT